MGFFDVFRKPAAPKAPARPPAAPPQPPPAAPAEKPAASVAPRLSPPATPASPVPSATAPVPPAPKSPLAAPLSPAAREQDCRVLFVGVEPVWFSEIERDLPALQPTWSCLSAVDVAQAEALLTSVAFDAVVLDGNSSAAASLAAPGRKIGSALCVVRCDMSDRAEVALWNRRGTTPVSVDGDVTTLIASLKRAWRLREWMAVPAIKKLLLKIRKLPVQPKLHHQVTDELQSMHGSMQVVAKLISQDPVMSAKILQMVNSAFFGLAHEVNDIAEAVMMLGTERVKSLILLAGVFSDYSTAKCPGFSPEPIWNHSLQVALLARAIALGETRNARTSDAAFTAGLLHDVGKLFIAGNLPEMFAEAQRQQQAGKMSPRGAELAVMGATHAELGACLLATWGLPLPILEAIAWHHEPERSTEKGFTLLAAVHVANVFAQESVKTEGGVHDQIEVQYLTLAGLGDCRDRWREFCGTAASSDAAAAPKG